jgi:hypothetical protein
MTGYAAVDETQGVVITRGSLWLPAGGAERSPTPKERR